MRFREQVKTHKAYQTSYIQRWTYAGWKDDEQSSNIVMKKLKLITQKFQLLREISYIWMMSKCDILADAKQSKNVRHVIYNNYDKQVE